MWRHFGWEFWFLHLHKMDEIWCDLMLHSSVKGVIWYCSNTNTGYSNLCFIFRWHTYNWITLHFEWQDFHQKKGRKNAENVQIVGNTDCMQAGERQTGLQEHDETWWWVMIIMKGSVCWPLWNCFFIISPKQTSSSNLWM